MRRLRLLVHAGVLATAACGRGGLMLEEEAAPTPPTGAQGVPPDAFCNPLRADLVACWHLDGNFVDDSRYGRTSFASNVTYTDGPAGLAAVLGPASNVQAGDDGTFPAGQLTVEAWVRPDALPGTGRSGIVDKNGQFGLFAYPGNQLTCSAGGTAVTTTGALAVGVWTHLACTKSATELVTFVDGVPRGRAPGAGLVGPGTESINLGEDSPDGDDQFLGALDEIRLWSVALDSASIAASAGRGSIP